MTPVPTHRPATKKKLAKRRRNNENLPTTVNVADFARPKATKLVMKMTSIQQALAALLRRAASPSTDRVISWTSVDLAGLWEVSKNHERHITQLLKCTYPRDRARIENLITQMRVNLLSQGADHLKTLGKSLPQISHAIYRSGK